MPNDKATMTAGSPKVRTKIYFFKEWLLLPLITGADGII